MLIEINYEAFMYKKFVENLQREFNLNDIVKSKDGYYIPFGINNFYYGKNYRELYLSILRKKY